MTNKEIMSEFLEQAKSILDKIETRQETSEKQINAYKEIIDRSISFNKERIDSIERRWNSLRTVVISISILCIGYFMTAGSMIVQRPTNKEIDTKLEEYATEEELFRAFGREIEDRYDILTHKGILTEEEAKQGEKDIKKQVIKEIDPNYVTRGVEIK